jgi:hypothetical protein
MPVSPRAAALTLALAVATYLHGLGSLHILVNGDEMIYAQIVRATAASGQWLPLVSEMPDMVNTKPPFLFWQGILSTDWGRRWTLAALRWPSLVWTFATAAMAGLLAWRAGGRGAVGTLAAAIYLAFLSTYRYGRPFLTNPPETFWMFGCFFVMLWWRPRAAVLFAVFCLPTQRSGRYLLEAMPGIAVLMALHWHRILPSAFLVTLAGAGVIVGLVAWVTVLLVRDLGAGVLPWAHWGILGGAAAIVLVALGDRRRPAACAVPAALAAFLTVSSLLTAFDPPRGGYSAATVAAARGRVVHVPQGFRAAAERASFLLPGAVIRAYPDELADRGPANVGPDELVVVVRPFSAPAPPGALDGRITISGRHTPRQFWEMATGRFAETLFRREWLVRPAADRAAAGASKPLWPAAGGFATLPAARVAADPTRTSPRAPAIPRHPLHRPARLRRRATGHLRDPGAAAPLL